MSKVMGSFKFTPLIFLHLFNDQPFQLLVAAFWFSKNLIKENPGI